MNKKMTEELLYELAIYYLSNNISIEKLGEMYGIEKSVLIKYFAGQKTIKLPPYLQEKINSKKEYNWIIGKSTNGNLGKLKLNEEQLNKIILEYLEDKTTTLKRLAEKYGVSRTTLYNCLKERNVERERKK